MGDTSQWTYQITFPNGIAWRHSPDYNDRITDEDGPPCMSQLTGNIISGDVKFLRVMQPDGRYRFVPILSPKGTELAKLMPTVVFSGIVDARAGWGHWRFKQRFFVLTKEHILWFNNKDEYKGGTDPVKQMELQQLDEVNQIEKGAATFELLLADKTKWDVRWPSLDQAKPWVSQLRVASPQLLPGVCWPTHEAPVVVQYHSDDNSASGDDDSPTNRPASTSNVSSDGRPADAEHSEPSPKDRRAAAASRRRGSRRRSETAAAEQAEREREEVFGRASRVVEEPVSPVSPSSYMQEHEMTAQELDSLQELQRLGDMLQDDGENHDDFESKGQTSSNIEVADNRADTSTGRRPARRRKSHKRNDSSSGSSDSDSMHDEGKKSVVRGKSRRKQKQEPQQVAMTEATRSRSGTAIFAEDCVDCPNCVDKQRDLDQATERQTEVEEYAEEAEQELMEAKEQIVASTVEHQREVRALNAKLAGNTAALEAMTKKLEAADRQIIELSTQLAEPPVRKGCWK